jgi:hypothetical protein
MKACEKAMDGYEWLCVRATCERIVAGISVVYRLVVGSVIQSGSSMVAGEAQAGHENARAD